MSDQERAIRRRAKRARRAARDKDRPAPAPAPVWALDPIIDEEGERAMIQAEQAAWRAQFEGGLGDYLDHIHDDLAAILAHLGISRRECEPWMPEPVPEEAPPDPGAAREQ